MFAAALATVLAAASVTAPAPAPAAAPSPAPVAVAVAARQTDPRVCVVSRITGSLIPVKQCQKYSDWLAEGTDPLAKTR